MDKDTFLSLCDEHKRIIHSFGSQASCTRQAGQCAKGCGRAFHQQKGNRHESISAKQFYMMVGSIRKRYEMFKANLKDFYLVRYIQQIKSCIATFQKYALGEHLEKHPLIDCFCRAPVRGDMTQQIIEDPLDEIEFSEVKCKEVFNIKFFQQMLQKQTMADQEKKIIKFLRQMFDTHLKNNKILASPQKQQQQPFEKTNKEQEIFQFNKITSLIENLQSKITSLDFFQRQEKLDNMVLIMKLNEVQFQKKELMNSQQLNGLFSALQSYVEKTLPDKISIAANFPLSYNLFWEKLIVFVGNKGLKSVRVWSTAQKSTDSRFQEEIKSRYKEIMEVEVGYKVKWDEIASNIGLKSDK